MKPKGQAGNKVVWVIGAGASVSDSSGHFPTLLQIPAKAREMGLLTTDSSAEPGLKKLSGYLRSRFYGDLLNPDEPVNLEHVLSLLEIDIAVAAEPDLLLARKSVLRLLRMTFLRLARTAPQLRGQYARMVAALGSRDTVITFNWDTLLDGAFGRTDRLKNLGTRNEGGPVYGDPHNRYDRFLLQLTGWGERTIRGIGIPAPVYTPEDIGYFIKAHGSVDWYYCTNPSCRSYAAVFPLLASNKRPVCSGCRERTDVLIIPPTMNKRLRDLPLTRRLWTLAAAEMEAATEVIVWGYSLPPTDFFSEWVLRHARSTRCKKLALINPDVLVTNNGVARLNTAFITRFVQALRLPGRAIKLDVYSDYEQFVASQSAAKTHELKAQLRALARGQGD